MSRVSVAIEVKTVGNVIAGEERSAASGATFEKLAPATGEVLSLVARSDAADTDAAISAAADAQPAWAARTVEERGRILRRIAQLLERDREDVAAVVAAETGKSPKDARGETDGAIELGYFVAGEGRRFYGRTMPSAVPNRQAMTVRQPLGVAGSDHRREHADRERRLEGLPRAPLRERRRPEGVGGHARDRARLRPARRRGGSAARGAERRPGLRGGGRAAARRGSARRGRLLHRLDRGRADDRTGRGRASGEGLPRARRQESARRLRRRESRAGRRRRGPLGVLERRPALRRRFAADRLRRRLRALPRAARRAREGAEGRAGETSTTSGR